MVPPARTVLLQVAASSCLYVDSSFQTTGSSQDHEDQLQKIGIHGVTIEGLNPNEDLKAS